MPHAVTQSAPFSEIADELAAIDARLSEIETERQNLLQKKRELQQCQDKPTQLTPEQKIAIFRNLFKGRTDIFATRWQNGQGRSGYSVACHNEWVPGKCNKPTTKCNECQQRSYKPLGDQAIYSHLTGKQVIGLYPLLPDNTCHVLAADFDKTGWAEAVKAMAKTCDTHVIPHAIEISRSGNGAHLWIFFSEPVSAREARRLGFLLLDKTMEIHPHLSFDSYDRLFPNQDWMPVGGFGNLIALPLQQQARQQGNTQFVDTSLIAHPDQWGFLAAIQRLSPQQLNALLEQMSPTLLQITDEYQPWEQCLPIEHTRIDNCPRQITVTLANRIYISLEQLPTTMVARLKRLASFSNPVFFKTQALRFSTHGIPRYICCAQIEQGYLSLPRGCLDEVLGFMREQEISIAIDDKRNTGQALPPSSFLGELRKTQQEAIRTITHHDVGILHVPTAFGKTVTAISIIKKRHVNTLILTHTRQLLEQWQERIPSFLSGVEVGIVGGGKKKPGGQIDIATYQSLINKKDNTVSELIQQYGQIIIDECHHISAPRFEMVLNEVRSKYVLGLTATPDRQDGHQKIMFMLAGPIRYKVKTESGLNFKQTVIVAHRNDPPNQTIARSAEHPHIADVYQWLATNGQRNADIINDVVGSIRVGCHPLLLTERREHAEILAQNLTDKGLGVVVLRGAMGAKQQKLAREQLPQAQVVVATGKYAGEGFDLPRLDTLFLALPIAWKGSLAQYAGRIHRESAGKESVTIHDYVDDSLPMLQRMFRKREKGYQAMGYNIIDATQALQTELALDNSG